MAIKSQSQDPNLVQAFILKIKTNKEEETEKISRARELSPQRPRLVQRISNTQPSSKFSKIYCLY